MRRIRRGGWAPASGGAPDFVSCLVRALNDPFGLGFEVELLAVAEHEPGRPDFNTPTLASRRVIDRRRHLEIALNIEHMPCQRAHNFEGRAAQPGCIRRQESLAQRSKVCCAIDNLRNARQNGPLLRAGTRRGEPRGQVLLSKRGDAPRNARPKRCSNDAKAKRSARRRTEARRVAPT